MKVKNLFYTLAIGTALGFASSAQAAHHKEKGSSDQLFVTKASEGGLAEVELGKIAASNGDAQDVKDFGSKMVTDHSQLNDSLKAVADKDKLTVADKPNEMQQAMIDKLSKETGKEFDTNYVHAMLHAHMADKHLFATEVENTSNPDLKKAASDALVVIKQHLDMIEGIADAHGLASGSKHHHKAMDMSSSSGSMGSPAAASSDAGQSKSGAGPGSTGSTVPDASPAAGDEPGSGTPAAPSTGDAAQSKSGTGPGANANPAPNPQ